MIQSEYYTEMKHFMHVMLGLLITACVLVFIIVIYRVWVWIKLNPKILPRPIAISEYPEKS